jgi:integrase
MNPAIRRPHGCQPGTTNAAVAYEHRQEQPEGDPRVYWSFSSVMPRTDPYQPVFLRHDDGRGKPGPRGEHWRLSPQSVWGVVKKYGALAGVEVTTHHLRHLKTRVMLNNGAQLSEVQDILGHASPETTKKIDASYTKQHLRDAFDRFSLPAEEVARRVRR